MANQRFAERGWRVVCLSFLAHGVEALWKPQPPGLDPARPAEFRANPHFIDSDPDPTHSRPPSLGLCKQEVTGSIPVGSTRGSARKSLGLLGALSRRGCFIASTSVPSAFSLPKRESLAPVPKSHPPAPLG